MSEITSEPQEWACGHLPDPSRKRYEEKRHKKIVDQAIKILQGGSPGRDFSFFDDNWTPISDSAYKGLIDADEVNPYYNYYTFTSHFYDPDTQANYLPTLQKDPTAKTEACRFFRLSLAHRYNSVRAIDSNYPVPRGSDPSGYYLGLALHYLTDLGQPMHAANVINRPPLDWRHSGFELAMERNLADFHAAIPKDGSYLDKILTNFKQLEDLVHSLAVRSKNVFQSHVKKVYDEIDLQNSAPPWSPDQIKRCGLEDILPETERQAAALLLLWTRGYDTIVRRLYRRYLRPDGPPPSDLEVKHYSDRLISQEYTVRKIITEMGCSDEYYEKKVKPKVKEPAAILQLLYEDFLNRVPDKEATPKKEAWEKDNGKSAWEAYVKEKTGSKEYLDRFGDHAIPGYKGISELPDPIKR